MTIHYLVRGHISNKLHLKPEFEEYADKFKKETGISIYNFRDRLYEVTRSLIKEPIVNRSTFELDNEVKEKLLSLPDDDIIVPLDDDDWINPIFQPQGDYTVCNYIHFDINQPNYTKYQTEQIKLSDYNLSVENFKKISTKYFPSCSYSLSIKLIKEYVNKPVELHRIIFKHGTVPMVMHRHFIQTGRIFNQIKLENFNCFLTHIGNYSTPLNGNIRGVIDRVINTDIEVEDWMRDPYCKLKNIYRDFWG